MPRWDEIPNEIEFDTCSFAIDELIGGIEVGITDGIQTWTAHLNSDEVQDLVDWLSVAGP